MRAILDDERYDQVRAILRAWFSLH
jgi:hypothetical protein